MRTGSAASTSIQRNFFAQFAVDPLTEITPSSSASSVGSKEEFIADRNKLPRRHASWPSSTSFKIGDTVPLQGDIYPGDWRFKVAGFVEAADASVAQTMYFHWARLNEGLPETREEPDRDDRQQDR